MTASPSTPSPSTVQRAPLRVWLRGSTSDTGVDGAWWPQSRDLQVEAADLVDNLGTVAGGGGYINRLLFSRPDWDEPVVDGRGVRRIRARRGPVKVGSFPDDDTQLMVLLLADGGRVHLQVVDSATDPAAADQQLQRIATDRGDGGAPAAPARWPAETPGT